MITDILTRVGLTDEQADLYQSLLSHGSQTATGLSKTTKIQRTYIYQVAQELIKMGLIRTEKEKGKTRFIPLSPDFLTTQAEEQKTRAHEAQIALESILPELKTKYTAIEDRPVVQTYEGVEGLKKIYQDTLKVGKLIKAVLQTSEVDPDLYHWLNTIYVKNRVVKKIPASVIVASGKWSNMYIEKNDQELRETIVVDSTRFPFKHEVDIYGSKVAFINYKKGEPLVGIIIDNQMIADTMNAWFDLAWAGAKRQ